jgi:hypothetical protein
MRKRERRGRGADLGLNMGDMIIWMISRVKDLGDGNLTELVKTL